jgi:hypothetical protein
MDNQEPSTPTSNQIPTTRDGARNFFEGVPHKSIGKTYIEATSKNI